MLFEGSLRILLSFESFNFVKVYTFLCLLQNEGVPSFRCVPLCFVYSSGRRKQGVHHLLNESCPPLEGNESCPRLEGVVPPFFSGELVGRKDRNWFWCVPSICEIVGLAPVTVACFFLSHEPPTQSVLIKNKNACPRNVAVRKQLTGVNLYYNKKPTVDITSADTTW